MLFKVKKIVVLTGLFVSSTNVWGMPEDRGNYDCIRRHSSMPELRYLGNFHGGDIFCDITFSDLNRDGAQSKENTDNIIEAYTDEATGDEAYIDVSSPSIFDSYIRENIETYTDEATDKAITDDFSKNESDKESTNTIDIILSGLNTEKKPSNTNTNALPGASDKKIDESATSEVYNGIIKLYTGKYSGINPVEKDQEDMSAEKGLKNDPSVENPGSTPRIKDQEDTSARKGLENTPRIKDKEDTSAGKGLKNDPSVENPGSTPRIKDKEDTSAGEGLKNDPILSKRVTTTNKQSKNNEKIMNQHRQNLSTEAKKIEGQRVDQQKKKQVQEKLRNKRFRRKLPNFLKNTETFLKKVITKLFER